MASPGKVYFGLLLSLIIGLGLVVAAACTFNNVIDRHLDAKMKRTQNRAVAAGDISPQSALIYGCLLALIGFSILVFQTNQIAVSLTAIAFISYVAVYGYAKRHSVYGTIVGAVPGALPPVIGYCAVTGEVDWASLCLFALLFLWQLPHFYAIALYRRHDYAAAELPVASVHYGIDTTKKQTLAYMILFCLAVVSLYLFSDLGLSYLVGGLGLALYWLIKAWRTWSHDATAWGRQVFGLSLLVNVGLAFLIAFGTRLP